MICRGTVARIPVPRRPLHCVLLLCLLCGTAAAAPTNGAAPDTSPAYPPPGHLRVFDDLLADEMEYRRKHAERAGQTDQAVDMTWRLSFRIRQVWGPEQSIQWRLYTGVARLWYEAGAHDRALAALARIQTELSTAFWFDDFERAALSLYTALVHADAEDDEIAEAAFRRAFDLAERTPDMTADDIRCFRARFADVLGRNGKTTEAAVQKRLAAGNGAGRGPGCGWRL